MSRDFQPTNPETPLGGRYKIISELGAGGFGQTFLAEDLHLPGHPQCVVKQLKPQTKDAKSLAMARRLFDTEAEVLYQLGDHDQIPRLLAHFEDEQEFYLAQEFIEGEPITKEIVVGEPWSEVRVLALLQDILEILAFVHQQQVIHRDLKPANLIRRRCDGRIVLIDFGAVKQVSTQVAEPDTGQTNLTISIGTKGYMPNEQLAGNPRFSSDIYAVGRLGIQALTGMPPKRLAEDPKTSELDWRKYAPHICPEVAAMLECMVRYDFRDRYPTAAEALLALRSLPESLLESLPPLQPLPEIKEATFDQELPSLPTPTGATEIEIEQTPTNIWEAAELLELASTSASSPETTALLSQQQCSLPPSKHLAVTRLTSGLWQRQFVKFWPIFAILAAVGVTFAITKSLISPQPASQTAIRRGTSAEVSASTPTPPPQKPEATALLSQANQLREAGEYQKAIEVYDQAIALKPKLAQAYWGRCESLNKLQKPADAIVSCNDALDLKRNYAEAYWSKGNALEQQELPLEALQLYEKATKLKPDFAEGWVSYGIALQGFGRSVEAIEALDKGIALKRNSADAWSTRGGALWNLGRFNQALPSLDKALQIQPNHPEALKLRQQVRKELGR